MNFRPSIRHIIHSTPNETRSSQIGIFLHSEPCLSIHPLYKSTEVYAIMHKRPEPRTIKIPSPKRCMQKKEFDEKAGRRKRESQPEESVTLKDFGDLMLKFWLYCVREKFKLIRCLFGDIDSSSSSQSLLDISINGELTSGQSTCTRLANEPINLLVIDFTYQP